MTKREQAMALRNDAQRHWNCCQSVLIPFAQRCGLTEAEAAALGEHFGGGMRHGGACGALTGALMVLGMAHGPESAAKDFMDAFKQRNGALNCAELLKKAATEGIPRKDHCDDMVAQAVDTVEALLEG